MADSIFDNVLEFAEKQQSEKRLKAAAECDLLAPELPFDSIWEPIEQLALVIPGFGICPGPVHLVTGSWYTGKTLFLLAMGMAVAAGKPLFGLHFTNRGKWIHFDHEMGKRHYQRYMQRLRAGLGIDIEDMRGNVSPRILPRLNLCHPEAVDHYCRLLEGRQICTVDPLRAAAPGQNENDSEYRQWVDLLNTVSDKTGCSVVLLHHGGEARGRGETKEHRTRHERHRRRGAEQVCAHGGKGWARPGESREDTRASKPAR